VLGTDEARIAKSILFLADDQPLLVVLCGNMTVDPQKLLAQLNSRANQEAGTWGREPAIRTPVSTLILASRRQAEDMTGFRVGTIGPLALRQPITTVIDTQLAVFDQVFAGCGAADVEMRVSSSALVRVAACDGVLFRV
jgi:prolyl-tRNA editing enzyme YbaK/EbsC (Cys-tRNA(Pro) deacylase)